MNWEEEFLQDFDTLQKFGRHSGHSKKISKFCFFCYVVFLLWAFSLQKWFCMGKKKRTFGKCRKVFFNCGVYFPLFSPLKLSLFFSRHVSIVTHTHKKKEIREEKKHLSNVDFENREE